MYALFWLSDIFNKRVLKYSKTEQPNKLNQQGKQVKYPTTLLHLRKTDKTQRQTTLMLWEGNRQIQEYTNHHIFTTVYDQDSLSLWREWCKADNHKTTLKAMTMIKQSCLKFIITTITTYEHPKNSQMNKVTSSGRIMSLRGVALIKVIIKNNL